MKIQTFLFSPLVEFLVPSVFLAGFSNVSAEETVFGKEKQETGEAALMGILYDLKQTQDHKPTSVNYPTVLKEFIKSGWDESVLSRFYRITKPLYTTQIFIPLISANEAPKAFGAEKTVKTGRWVIHYRGQVVPPKNGTYRFWFFADDVCMIAINGKLYGIANHACIGFPEVWKSPEPMTMPVPNGVMRAGEWLDLKTTEPIDLDILVGEFPGGQFCAFILVEEKGEKYQMNGPLPILPIFQLAPFDTPVRNNGQPKFATGFPCWKGIQ